MKVRELLTAATPVSSTGQMTYTAFRGIVQ